MKRTRILSESLLVASIALSACSGSTKASAPSSSQSQSSTVPAVCASALASGDQVIGTLLDAFSAYTAAEAELRKAQTLAQMQAAVGHLSAGVLPSPSAVLAPYIQQRDECRKLINGG
jgi:hypothetical protein